MCSDMMCHINGWGFNDGFCITRPDSGWYERSAKCGWPAETFTYGGYMLWCTK